MPWKDTRPSALPPAAERFKQPLDHQVLARLHDAHCHPSDDDAFEADVLRGLKTGKLCAMSSSLDNQETTAQVYAASPSTVIPFFGLHPWFCHPISFSPPDSLPSKEAHYASLFPSFSNSSSPNPELAILLPHLPDPVSIKTFLASLESHLLAHPSSHVGEIGLDRAFRLPNPPHIAADKSNPKHSQLATPLAHQIRVVEAQVDLAIRLGRNVSFHSVRAPQETVELLKRFKAEKEGWGKLHVCLHSFGGSAESAKQIQKAHPNAFFSFATIISGRSPHFHSLLRAISPSRLLLESDYSHTAEIDHQIWEVFEEVQAARDWTAEETVKRLEENWEEYMKPMEERPEVKKTNREKKRERKRVDMYVSEDEAEEKREEGDAAPAEAT
ncbi:hypothetical protein JCM8097_000577 [Rhodosporidiobolus ruineniae]